MPSPSTIKRDAWLGYRWRQHGLGARGSDAVAALLRLGIQDSRDGAASQSLRARAASIDSKPIDKSITVNGPAVIMWSVRGAPHAHRANGLDFIRAAVAPQPSDDGGQQFIDAVDEVADALSSVVTGKTPKGDASTEVSDLVRGSLVRPCQRCKTSHVPDDIFRAAGRQAEVIVGPREGQATMLYPRPKVRQRKATDAREQFLEAVFRLNGPINREVFRTWAGAGTGAAAELFEDIELTKVKVDDQRFDLPPGLLDEIAESSPAKGSALVPSSDPYLRQTDRKLLMPNGNQRKQVFKPLSPPGAVLIDGEVVGTWRFRRSAKELTVSGFAGFSKQQRSQLEECARQVASAGGFDDPALKWS